MAKRKKVVSRHTHSHSHFHVIIVFLSLVIVTVGFALFQTKSNASNQKLDYQSQIAKKQCDTTGSPVIDVTQQVINDADSGEAGNYWGLDNFSRHIQAWKQIDATFCALVEYNGTFRAFAGQTSPGKTGILTGTEKGTIHGGYRATITGVLQNSPSLPTRGQIGPTNYQCDESGNCPGAFDWTTKYFNTSASNFIFTFDWWGWTYRNDQHVWVNSSNGNSGDII